MDFCSVFPFISSDAQANAFARTDYNVHHPFLTTKQAHISFHCQNHLDILATQDTFFMLTGSYCLTAVQQPIWKNPDGLNPVPDRLTADHKASRLLLPTRLYPVIPPWFPCHLPLLQSYIISSGERQILWCLWRLGQIGNLSNLWLCSFINKYSAWQRVLLTSSMHLVFQLPGIKPCYATASWIKSLPLVEVFSNIKTDLATS